jgi:oleandomycin transport system ATP-binding protein
MTYAIEAEGLVKRFGETTALDGVGLTVPTGRILGVLGPNGAGKTTAVRILATLLRPDAGMARVGGFDVLKQPVAVRQLIGLTGQYASVDEDLSGRENLVLIGRLLEMAKTDARTRARELLDRFELSDAADRAVKTYSGGMRRRLDLAASLVGHPQVLYLDEPTTGLDPHSRNEVWDIVRRLAEDGVTVLLTTQYLEEADQLADEIAILHGGRIVASGTPDELKALVPTGLVELEFGDETQLAVAQSALGEQYEVSRADSKLVVATAGSVAEMADMFIRLKDSGVEPTGFSRQLPTLDDVFFKFLDDEKEDRHASAH